MESNHYNKWSGKLRFLVKNIEMQQNNHKGSEHAPKYTANPDPSSLLARKTLGKEQNAQKPENPKNAIKPNTHPNAIYSLHSLFLSLGFFAWWLFWAWASLGKAPYLQKLVAGLHIFWLGLPLWFWLSCVASLPLLWIASWFLLPEDAKPTKTCRQAQPNQNKGHK